MSSGDGEGEKYFLNGIVCIGMKTSGAVILVGYYENYGCMMMVSKKS